MKQQAFLAAINGLCSNYRMHELSKDVIKNCLIPLALEIATEANLAYNKSMQEEVVEEIIDPNLLKEANLYIQELKRYGKPMAFNNLVNKFPALKCTDILVEVEKLNKGEKNEQSIY